MGVYQGETKSSVAIPVPVVSVVHQHRMKFVKDGQGKHINMLPGQPFQHTFRLLNNGVSKWTDCVTVRCVGGDALKGSERSVHLPGIQPQQMTDATVHLCAPAVEGRYICYFRLHDGDVRFGDRIWIDISVVAKAADVAGVAGVAGVAEAAVTPLTAVAAATATAETAVEKMSIEELQAAYEIQCNKVFSDATDSWKQQLAHEMWVRACKKQRDETLEKMSIEQIH